MRIALPLLLVLACATGCEVKEKTPDYAQLAEDLTFHRQLWEDQHVASYVGRLQQTCDCPAVITQPVRMQVEGNTVVSVANAETGAPVDSLLWIYFPPINQLFNIIGVEIESRVDRLDVVYHAELGYPTSIFIDPLGGTSGDEMRYAVEVESYTITTARLLRSAPGGN